MEDEDPVNDQNHEVCGCRQGIKTEKQQAAVIFREKIPGNQKVNGKISDRHGQGKQEAGEPDHIIPVRGIVIEEIKIQEPDPGPENKM